MLDVVEYSYEHLVFAQTELCVVRILVGTVVNDAVHVEIQTIEFGDSVLSNELGDGRIALGEPPEEFGNTHGDGVVQNGVCVCACECVRGYSCSYRGVAINLIRIRWFCLPLRYGARTGLLAAAKDAKTERPSYGEADDSKEGMEIAPAVAEKEGVDVEVKCDVVDSCAAELRFTLRQAGL